MWYFILFVCLFVVLHITLSLFLSLSFSLSFSLSLSLLVHAAGGCDESELGTTSYDVFESTGSEPGCVCDRINPTVAFVNV